MSERRVLVLMGTRPEAIKLAPVVLRLDEAPGLVPVTVSTGQHKEMLHQVVDRFGLRLDRDLAVMRPDQTLAGLTARLLDGIDDILTAVEPDLVVVQGDTTTAFTGALAAFYRRVPVAHVEAGLRTGRLDAPFPEEANRVLVGRLADLHFAPTSRAEERLLAEGVPAERITVSGNTVIDALMIEEARQTNDPAARQAVDAVLGPHLGPDWREGPPLILITAHRRESFGGGFVRICEAIADLAERFPDHRFVFPVHLNPQVRRPVGERLKAVRNVVLLDPLPYPELVALLRACRLVLTDSGGIQEEAPGFGKPVLVMRETTERAEGVEAGVVRLVGTDCAVITAEATCLLSDESAYDAMARATNPYGDGHAAARIVERIGQFLQRSNAGPAE